MFIDFNAKIVKITVITGIAWKLRVITANLEEKFLTYLIQKLLLMKKISIQIVNTVITVNYDHIYGKLSLLPYIVVTM